MSNKMCGVLYLEMVIVVEKCRSLKFSLVYTCTAELRHENPNINNFCSIVVDFWLPYFEF